MAQIDRTEKEKVINIFGKKIKYGTICVLGLLLILFFSSFGAYTSFRKAPQDDEQQDNKIEVSLVVVFDRNNTVSKLAQIEPNGNALFAFKEIANITTQETAAGKTVYSVSAGNKTLANNETHAWLFYVNGRIYFKGLEQYTVQNRDNLELQYGRNFG